MSIFEAGMMVCFGISWPVAAYKTYKAKCVHGKSIYFSLLILLGYVCGILHKIFYSMDYVFILYILNTIFLLLDMYLWFKYRNNNPDPDISSISKLQRIPLKKEDEINEEIRF